MKLTINITEIPSGKLKANLIATNLPSDLKGLFNPNIKPSEEEYDIEKALSPTDIWTADTEKEMKILLESEIRELKKKFKNRKIPLLPRTIIINL